jgi:carboxyvinyl-carboxyphosphonate phosphorylmutase
MKKTTLLRKMLLDPEILVMPGAHDALSARIIEQVGFRAISLGGAACSICTLGKPDVGLVTLTEMTAHIRNIAEAVNVPVFADGDTGHGNVTNVIRTTREFEKAGAAGFFIEDQVAPKRCGHREGKKVIATEEMIAKLKAAVDARVDEDLVIMARTDALAIYGMEEAIERLNRYREAGADLLLVDALTTKEEMIRLNREVPAPTMVTQVEGGRTPICTTKELQDMGFATVVYPGSSFFAAAYGIKKVMEEIRHRGATTAFQDRMILFNGIDEIVGLEKVRDLEGFYYKDILVAQGETPHQAPSRAQEE